ncbi:prolipoprotein diacylglyceryl transferase [Henriciella sp.]|mgnify:CR=1 FL=1|uniref:prolipoprotein diacylglyceryl transferase n=1 Tax=Henriciella sp. TaxID=1968823 RepID=UPI00261A5A25|nr:prolipoprotein diacylglyceryl transferase [Henriciella sp.]
MYALTTAALSFPEFSPALIEIDLGFLGLPTFPIRWYALAYIAGLVIGWRYALALVRRPNLWGGQSPATRDDIDDLLFYVTLGVILGGRIGYILFYQLPFQFEFIQRDPWSLLRIWEGGMSFHGGLLGVAVAILIIARQRGIKLMPIADIAGVVTPIGLFFGRCANFINAELFGRPTDLPIGMVFPEGNAGGTPSAYNWETNQWVYTGAEVARHPSQLYEATLEGLIPAIIISVLVWRFGLLKRPGMAAGLFLLLYGIGRSIVEQFRMPDSFTLGVMPEWLTMGQLLSLPMWLGGAFLVWNSMRKPPASAASA